MFIPYEEAQCAAGLGAKAMKACSCEALLCVQSGTSKVVVGSQIGPVPYLFLGHKIDNLKIKAIVIQSFVINKSSSGQKQFFDQIREIGKVLFSSFDLLVCPIF